MSLSSGINHKLTETNKCICKHVYLHLKLCLFKKKRLRYFGNYECPKPKSKTMLYAVYNQRLKSCMGGNDCVKLYDETLTL